MVRRKSYCKIIGLLLLMLFWPELGYAHDYYVKRETQKWVYDTMAIFARQGYIGNYPQAWVESGHELSRFEIAFYIKQFVERPKLGDQTKVQLPPETAVSFQKLLVEFEGELAALGIKTTEIYDISPNLVAPDQKNSDYQDIDLILKPDSGGDSAADLPYYYYGQYYNASQRKSFLFLPAEYVNSRDLDLLEGDLDNVNIVYPNNSSDQQLFVVVKGNLPLADQELITGYFMFPIDGPGQIEGKANFELDRKVLALLDEIKQLQHIENLWRYEGSLPLNDYLKLNSKIQKNLLWDQVQSGIQIGSTLIFSDTTTLNSKYEANQFGLPSYSLRQSTPVDWDLLKQGNPDLYQINIKGMMNLNPQTSVYGEIDLLYSETREKSLFEGLMPPKVKYSAGVNYQMNDYWKFLSYQSFVNSRNELKSELLSTTSFGVEYNDWITLWLAYQMLDFKSDPTVTGVLSFRF
ncbi:MAG TPA: hypothetical protein VIM29_09870 [Bacillota bacterium]